MSQWLRIQLLIQEMWVRSLGQEDLLEKKMATHSSILAWKIPWTVEPGRLQSKGSRLGDFTSLGKDTYFFQFLEDSQIPWLKDLYSLKVSDVAYF